METFHNLLRLSGRLRTHSGRGGQGTKDAVCSVVAGMLHARVNLNDWVLGPAAGASGLSIGGLLLLQGVLLVQVDALMSDLLLTLDCGAGEAGVTWRLKQRPLLARSCPVRPWCLAGQSIWMQ
jgi:hypothetical protein